MAHEHADAQRLVRIQLPLGREDLFGDQAPPGGGQPPRELTLRASNVVVESPGDDDEPMIPEPGESPTSILLRPAQVLQPGMQLLVHGR